MSVWTVIKRKENGGLVTFVYGDLQSAIDCYPIIGAYEEFYWEMKTPYGMNITDELNVKECFLY